MQFLSLVQPFMSVLPEVAQAERKIPFRCAAVVLSVLMIVGLLIYFRIVA